MEGDIKNVIEYWMEGEISNFIKVWLSVYICLFYCYIAGKIIPKGKPRFFVFLPVVCLFLALPLNLHTVHLGGTTAFFITWLGNFKLLLFAFGKGPLSDPSISLPRFLLIACLPIKIQQQNLPPKTSQKTLKPQNNGNPFQNGHFKENPSPKTSKKGHNSLLNYAVKGLLLASFFKVYDYSDHIHPKLILFIYSLHIYFFLEIILAIVAALARTLIGLELERQFDEPFLSTSLQEFWGRRWNLMVTRILRPTVYDPVLNVSTKILGRQWAPLPAVFSTFIVSALMHELIIYYLGRMKPTWEITWFFLLHGVCLMGEIGIKKAFTGGRFRLPRVVSRGLTVVFVMATGFWLFFPQLLRCKADVRSFEEYDMVGAFIKDFGRALTMKVFNVTMYNS